jgi:heptose I phosphotransferase
MLVLPRAWIERWHAQDTFNQLFSIEGKVYRQQGGRKTLRFTLDGKNYFAKFHRGVGWKRIIKDLLQLRLPVISAKTEWRAIQRLEQLGISTMHLVGYGKRGWNPARLQSFVITEELANTVSLEDFCRDWPTLPPSCSLKRALITEVARIARTLHEHGINHRDFYICHFLLDISMGRERIDPRHLSLYLIDLHRMQMRRRLPWRWRVKDIGSLYFSSMDIGLSKRDLLRFIRVYRNKPLRACIGDHRLFWWRVKRRAIALYREFFQKDPTILL